MIFVYRTWNANLRTARSGSMDAQEEQRSSLSKFAEGLVRKGSVIKSLILFSTILFSTSYYESDSNINLRNCCSLSLHSIHVRNLTGEGYYLVGKAEPCESR